ncbi:MAG: ATP-binding protein [Nitrospina sp.]|nr:ATP-binding protein [Nitrospina sp.]
MKETTHSETIPLEDRDTETWTRNNREVVRLGLDWFRLLLESYIQFLRSGLPEKKEASGHTVMSDLAADWLLGSLERKKQFSISADVHSARERFDAARAKMKEAETPSALDHLSACFNLAPFDEDVLVLALGPFTEAGFGPLFGYAHDRLNLTQGTPYLALSLFAQGNDEAAALAYKRFSPRAPLRRFALVETDGESLGVLSPFRIGERVGRLLLGDEYCEPSVEALLTVIAPGHCPSRHEGELGRLARTMQNGGLNAGMILGPKRSGRHVAAVKLAGLFGLQAVELKTREMPQDPAQRRAQFARLSREAVLGQTAVVIDLSARDQAVSEENRQAAFRVAEDALRYLESLVLVIADEHPDLPDGLPCVHLKSLATEDRVEVWSRELKRAEGEDGREIETLSEHFVLGPGEIASLCRGLHAAESPDLWQSCMEVAGRGLDHLAEKIESRYTWEDLLLPQEVMHDLKAIAAQVRYRPQVYGHGGFGKRLVRGRGVSALFAGPSGVGKTMAAEVIANELGLGLYKVDLSSVISKYIGETEKNLKRVFDSAEAGGAVLFFDEADALFGKRSEVKDSHDRYANIEVSYLLQRMETYSGLSILATNMKNHLDVAFLRRLRFVIDIPFPDASLRQAIWKRAFPEETATRDLDYTRLGRLELAGGNIVVIAVNAAFLAAADGTAVTMQHIARAARSEMRKLDQELRLDWVEGV